MRKGFTLIELLAVIAILAIIALIAVPIVINIINDAKKESLQRSVDLYIDHVGKAIAKYQINHTGFNPSTCNIKENGNIDCEGVELQVEIKGQAPEAGTIVIENNKIKYRGVVLGGMEYTLKEDGTVDVKVYVASTPASTDVDYRGYYADVDGDGEADGIIYADLAHSQSQTSWGFIGIYSYEAQTNLNEYTVSGNTYKKNDGFGENKIIKLKKDNGNPRFYVMALEDFRTGAIEGDNPQNYMAPGTYTWYFDALGDISTSDAKRDFGTGYENTGKMIEIWNKNGEGVGSYSGAAQYDYDIFKHIQVEYSKGWYIPSAGEWGAFGDYFTTKTNLETKLSTSSYNSEFGLSDWYWTSSAHNSYYIYFVQYTTCLINNDRVDGGDISFGFFVRLGTNF